MEMNSANKRSLVKPLKVTNKQERKTKTGGEELN